MILCTNVELIIRVLLVLTFRKINNRQVKPKLPSYIPTIRLAANKSKKYQEETKPGYWNK